MTSLVRSRIAPTPSGYLHIGNAYNFLLTENIVRSTYGHLRLRIDDLDALRVRPDYVQDIFESLLWLSIRYDEGPRDIQDQELQFSQRLRLAEYEKLLNALVATNLVFACSCSRKELLEHSRDGQYTGTCLQKHIPLDAPDVSWRIRTPETTTALFEDRVLGQQRFELWEIQRHFVIRRRDGLPAYHVASLADDMAYGINTIVRGQDLLSSTAAQLYLADVLGLDAFQNASFYHHPLIADVAGQKLSKSAGSSSLKAMRAAGVSANDIRQNAVSWYSSFLSV
jgi:glutamyl-tRNA synthetase